MDGMEERRAARRITADLAECDRDRQEQAERIHHLQAKLTASQTAEAELKRHKQAFQDRERELPLTIEREVSGRLDQVRATAASEAEQRLSLQVSDKDRTVRDMTKKLEEASRKAQQRSQQAQGETLELVLEDQLRRQLPFDELQSVPKAYLAETRCTWSVIAPGASAAGHVGAMRGLLRGGGALLRGGSDSRSGGTGDGGWHGLLVTSYGLRG